VKRSVGAPVLVLALALLAGLIVSALEPMQIRAYSSGIPNTEYVALVARGQEACEGPVRVQPAAGAVRIWGNGAGGPAWVQVIVRNATSGRAMARGWTLVPHSPPAAYEAALNTSIPSGSTIVVCIAGQGPSPIALGGAGPAQPVLAVDPARKTIRAEFSLVLLERSRHSLLTALPTAFARAALFRFSWTGPWMFWVLTIAFLGTIGACAWAVTAAARADAEGGAAPPNEQTAARFASHYQD
jgi:hypothetical protein